MFRCSLSKKVEVISPANITYFSFCTNQTAISVESFLAPKTFHLKTLTLGCLCFDISFVVVFQAKQLILENNLVLGTLEQHPKVIDEEGHYDDKTCIADL